MAMERARIIMTPRLSAGRWIGIRSTLRAMSRRILVAVAWPYASGSRHLGHLAGAYLPADIFARYQRLAGNQVLMVSGSDVHGTPITVRADQEGVEPQVIVDRYHAEFLRDWETLGISWDLYTSTGTPNHYEVTQEVFMRLLENGYLEKRTSSQFYDPEADRFLPDRYVQGTCPHCGYGEARGDQCDNCGRTLDPIDLIDPVSKISGATPVERDTEHYFLLLSRLEEPLREWLETKTTWRRHVRNWALGMVNEGLPDRAITRDLEWGVAARRRPRARQAHLCVVRRSHRLPLGFEGMGRFIRRSGRMASLVGGSRGRVLLLRGQGQHPLPHGDLAGDAHGLRRPQPPHRRPGQPVRDVRVQEGVGQPGCGPVDRLVRLPPRARRPQVRARLGAAGTPGHRPLRRGDHPAGERGAGGHVGQPRQQGAHDEPP